MAIDQKKLNELLDQVSSDVLTILTKADETPTTPLSKADPGKETPGEATPSGSSIEGSTPSSGDESSVSDTGDSSSTPPASATPVSASDASPDTGSASADAGSTDADPATDNASPEALQAEYAKLPIEELKLHVMAAHAALMAAVSTGQPDASATPQGAPPVPPASAAPPASAPEDTQSMGKKEFESEGSGGQIKAGKMAKSEKSDLELKLEKLEKSLKERDEQLLDVQSKFESAAANLVTFVNNKVALRKSISGVSYDSKPGENQAEEFKPLAKSEAVQKLNKLTASKDLKKSDRELINNYILGTADQATVAHLLK
jgi:hypothetical protein